VNSSNATRTLEGYTSRVTTTLLASRVRLAQADCKKQCSSSLHARKDDREPHFQRFAKKKKALLKPTYQN
jgi:hypothetical protein